MPSLLTLTLRDEVITYFLVDSGAAFEGNRRRSVTIFDDGEFETLPTEIRPVLTYGSRLYVDDCGAVRLCPPIGAPRLDRRPGSVRMRFTRREIVVSGDCTLLWKILRLVDGERTIGQILAELPTQDQQDGAQLLSDLGVVGALDFSGHPFRRFVHCGTKRGVLRVGALDSEQVRSLATNGSYRSYPDVPRLPLRTDILERLTPFYILTRSRRSCRDFDGTAVTRAELEGLLITACGVTGIVKWGDGELPLRAYPSGGALYPIEIYPVVFAVNGLNPSIYHYHAVDNVLEVVCQGIDRKPFLAAALPAEREMLGGASVLFCLTAVFARSERKYGEGIYRALAAEAGHISANLILAATALGLQARPWGGIFDDMLNQLMGFDPEVEQFLLGVILGHAKGERIDGPYRPMS
jgi:SagB-type dehydrogenase family enzyme